jgi:hypothetical protein
MGISCALTWTTFHKAVPRQTTAAGSGVRPYQCFPIHKLPLIGLCLYYFFILLIIGHKATAAARWTLAFILRTFFNDAITVAVWTGFRFHCVPLLSGPTRVTANPPRPRASRRAHSDF